MNQPPTPQKLDLAELLLEHKSGLAGAVRGVLGPRADVREVLQDVYLRARRALDRGDDPQDRVGWLFVLTLNHSRDLRRKAQRRGSALDIEEVDEVELSTLAGAPDAAAHRNEAVAAARQAIHRLDDPLKEVFLLRVSAGLSFQGVADSLEIPIGTAKTRMRAALAKLRVSLSAFGPDVSLFHIAEPEGGAQ